MKGALRALQERIKMREFSHSTHESFPGACRRLLTRDQVSWCVVAGELDQASPGPNS